MTDTKNPANSPNPPRVRLYNDRPGIQWVVFFRTKDKPLRVSQISKDLVSRYPSVLEITKINRDKLRVVFSKSKEANAVVKNPLFTLEYRVYIPAHIVEIDGVITEESLTSEELLQGVGCFKNPNLPKLKILEVKQLTSIVTVGEAKKYNPSASFRITFEGSALPNYLLLNKLRLPVRMYNPKLMNCTNCKQLGHTSTYCRNKAKCAKCAEFHKEDNCAKNAEKCILCSGDLHATQDCPIYKLRSEKLIRSKRERSKRSFADIVKMSTVNASLTENPFHALVDDDESDWNDDSDDTIEQSNASENVSQNRLERKRNSNMSPKLPRKKGALQRTQQKHTKYDNSIPAASQDIEFDRNFPELHKCSTSYNTKNKSTTQNRLFSFSTFVNWILKTLDVSENIKSIISIWLPNISDIVEQFVSKWPLLSALISFDG